MDSNVVAFPIARRARSEPPSRGVIYVWPHSDEGGSWCVAHASASGHSEAIVSRGHFTYDEAVAAARKAAVFYRAELKL